MLVARVFVLCVWSILVCSGNVDYRMDVGFPISYTIESTAGTQYNIQDCYGACKAQGGGINGAEQDYTTVSVFLLHVY